MITVEEQLSGWYTYLRRAKHRKQVALAYESLAISVELLSRFAILRFSEDAILRYENLRAMKLGVRGMDLRIAAIALENSGILVTRNLRDFKAVPGLMLEDWSV